jgi:hypothetical protein
MTSDWPGCSALEQQLRERLPAAIDGSLQWRIALVILRVHLQRIRPWIGVGAYALAILVGFISPLVAVVLFTVMVIFHAVTSEGIHAIPFLACRVSRHP